MTLKPRWHKVLRDLWGNKVRTLLVVLSIAIGVFAIGMIIGTQILLRDDLSVAWNNTNPSSAFLSTSRFDTDLLYTIKRVEGVADAEGRRSVRVPLLLGKGEQLRMNLLTMDDFSRARMHTVTPLRGQWPPKEGELVIERGSFDALNRELGESVTIETADGKLRDLTLVGVIYDISTDPYQFTQQPNGYVSKETLENLHYPSGYDELAILVDGEHPDKEFIETVVDRVESKLEKGGGVLYFSMIPEPGEHPAQEQIDPLLAILGILGVLSLGASAFLVVNIINSLLAQHTKQIGIMKSIGARSSQIMVMYFVTVLIFGLLSLLIAIPLGGWAAYGLTSYLASLINFDLLGFRIPQRAYLTQTAVALIIPILAALFPVIKGSRLTVREALSEQGLGSGQFGTHIVDRAVTWLTSSVMNLSRPMQISLRNTIRRKARLLLTLSTLTVGGAIFIGVLSVQLSLLATLDDALRYFDYDASFSFAHTHRIIEIEREAMKVDGVAMIESWTVGSARPIAEDGREGEAFSVFGVQADTETVRPILLEGRWLLPDDKNAIILNSLVLKDEPDIKLGDTITLKMEGRELEWKVVGIVQGVLTGSMGYANQEYLAHELHFVGRAGWSVVIFDQPDTEYHKEMAVQLKEHFDEAGMRVTNTNITANLRETIAYQFNIISTLLAVMAVLIALVGGLGLMGTMSINVLERTREIGVMRAVGASDGTILRIVLVEGILVGLLSWLLGSLLAYPMGQALSNVVGMSMLESPLNYTFSIKGAIGWLATVIVIASLASFMPAWNASRLSVRQTLEYE